MAFSAKLDKQLIGYLTLFENYTRAHVKDLLVADDWLVFVVEKGDIGKAIGKRGMHIKRLTYLMRKKIKVIELNERVEDFVKGVLDPLKIDNIKVEDHKVILTVKDGATKGKIIGRNGKNLQFLNDLLEKYFKSRAVLAA